MPEIPKRKVLRKSGESLFDRSTRKVIREVVPLTSEGVDRLQRRLQIRFGGIWQVPSSALARCGGVDFAPLKACGLEASLHILELKENPDTEVLATVRVVMIQTPSGGLVRRGLPLKTAAVRRIHMVQRAA